MIRYKTNNIKANGSKWNEKRWQITDSSWGFYSHSLLKPPEPKHFALLITVFVIHHGGEAHL